MIFRPRAGQYRTLLPEKVVATVRRLDERIARMFPDAGLRQVAGELLVVAEEASTESRQINRPSLWVVIPVSLVGTLMLVMLGLLIARLRIDQQELFSLGHFVEFLESLIQLIVFLGGITIYLASRGTQARRRRLLEDLRQLRALAHIIDMHQLTKTPDDAAADPSATDSGLHKLIDGDPAISPERLSRYLDFCIELLSLVSKIGAIYVQDFPDRVALEAVDQLSDLTNGLTRNIWQKIIILDRTPNLDASSALPAVTGSSQHAPDQISPDQPQA